MLKKLASLSADLNEKRAKKAQLEADVHMCTVKLDRAQKLIAGLGGEKTRWMAAAARLGQQFISLTGDIVLASAQIAYLGKHVSPVVRCQPSSAFVLQAMVGHLPSGLQSFGIGLQSPGSDLWCLCAEAQWGVGK